MKKHFRNALLILLVCFTSELTAQNYSTTANGVKATVEGVDVEIQFLSPGIVRVLKFPDGSIINKKSLSVIKTPETIQLSSNKTDDKVILTSSALTVELNLHTGRVTFSTSENKKLFTEKDYGTQFTATVDVKKQTWLARQAFLLDKTEAIYGLGQQQNGTLMQRGQRVALKNENTRICIPYFLSVKGYGVYWDNYASTVFTDNAQETSFESLADCSDYYFMYGVTPEGVIAAMRDLTGQVPMIPKWGFGYLQSRERYKNQDETVGVVQKYRDLKVPIDGIVQDWQYWGNDSNWNAMSFDAKTFPQPQQMVDKIHQLNAHLMIVAWPGFGPKTPQYQEYKSKNMLINFDTWPPKSGTKPYDVYSPEARDIYWNYLNKGVFSLNTDAWWLDSSEPDHINIKESDFDQPTFLGSYRSVVNAFPLTHVGGVYDHQRATTSAKRVFILTRSAFAGQQRYAANSWSGDIVASWETLQKQLPAALNFTLTGNPYWNADIGGFFLWNYNGSNALKLKSYQELYVRWLQFGTFTPMMRSHGTDAPREIYQFGKKGDWTYDAIEKYINLRYQLLPYIYSTAWNVTSNSGSFMRALMLDFSKDEKVMNINDEYMFGHQLLVAPVLKSMYVNKNDGQENIDFSLIKNREVYLPAGSEWFDFWTGEKVQGGTKVQKAAAIDIIPLFVKAGSVLPVGPKVQYASEKKWDKLEVRIYPGADGEFELFEDEGDNYNYEKGVFSTIRLTWNDKNKTLTISDRKGNFPGMLTKRTFNFVIVSPKSGIGNIPATTFRKSVQYSGKMLNVKF